MRRWRKIGDSWYANGNGYKAVAYWSADGCYVILRVYTEPGGLIVADLIKFTLASAKKWAENCYLKEVLT